MFRRSHWVAAHTTSVSEVRWSFAAWTSSCNINPFVLQAFGAVEAQVERAANHCSNCQDPVFCGRDSTDSRVEIGYVAANRNLRTNDDELSCWGHISNEKQSSQTSAIFSWMAVVALVTVDAASRTALQSLPEFQDAFTISTKDQVQRIYWLI